MAFVAGHNPTRHCIFGLDKKVRGRRSPTVAPQTVFAGLVYLRKLEEEVGRPVFALLAEVSRLDGGELDSSSYFWFSYED